MAFTSSEERSQVKALKAHQKKARGHTSTKKRVVSLTEALADAQADHAVAGAERTTAKAELLAALQDV